MGGATWFLVDDVSVIDCGNVPQAGNDTAIHAGDSVFLGINELLIPYVWFVRGDTTAIDSGGGIWVHPTVTTTYVVKQESLCGTESVMWDTVTVYVDTATTDTTHHHINNVAVQQLTNLRIYPSPAAHELTIEHAKGCTAVIYDVVGGKVLSTHLTTDRATLDVSALKTGVYMVEVTDAATGFRVVRQVLKE